MNQQMQAKLHITNECKFTFSLAVVGAAAYIPSFSQNNNRSIAHQDNPYSALEFKTPGLGNSEIILQRILPNPKQDIFLIAQLHTDAIQLPQIYCLSAISVWTEQNIYVKVAHPSSFHSLYMIPNVSSFELTKYSPAILQRFFNSKGLVKCQFSDVLKPITLDRATVSAYVEYIMKISPNPFLVAVGGCTNLNGVISNLNEALGKELVSEDARKSKINMILTAVEINDKKSWSEDIKEKGIKGLIVCVNENTDVEHLKEQLTPLANLVIPIMLFFKNTDSTKSTSVQNWVLQYEGLSTLLPNDLSSSSLSLNSQPILSFLYMCSMVNVKFNFGINYETQLNSLPAELYSAQAYTTFPSYFTLSASHIEIFCLENEMEAGKAAKKCLLDTQDLDVHITTVTQADLLENFSFADSRKIWIVARAGPPPAGDQLASMVTNFRNHFETVRLVLFYAFSSSQAVPIPKLSSLSSSSTPSSSSSISTSPIPSTPPKTHPISIPSSPSKVASPSSSYEAAHAMHASLAHIKPGSLTPASPPHLGIFRSPITSPSSTLSSSSSSVTSPSSPQFCLQEDQMGGMYGSLESDFELEQSSSFLVKSIFPFRCYYHNEKPNDELKTFWQSVVDSCLYMESR